MEYPDKSVFEGFYKYGKRSGKGTLKVKEDFEYEGEWEDDLQNGNGKLTTKEFLYEGQFKSGFI